MRSKPREALRAGGLGIRATASARRADLPKSISESLFAWLMISPGLSLTFALGAFPLFLLVMLSLFHINLTNPRGTGWAGLDNYVKLLGDAQFWHAMKVTAIYTLGSMSLQIVIGLALALLLFRSFRGQSVARTLVILPMILAPLVVGMLWRTLLLTPRFGMIDYIVQSIGLGSHAWLTDATLALPSVIVINVWQWTPFAFLVFLASLHALPIDIIEAARLDCVSWWHPLWYVILPLIRPAIVIVAILRLIATLNAFPQIYAATEGGPGTATQILNLYIYNTAFVGLSIGYGATLGTVQLVITLGVAILFFSMRRGR